MYTYVKILHNYWYKIQCVVFVLSHHFYVSLTLKFRISPFLKLTLCCLSTQENFSSCLDKLVFLNITFVSTSYVWPIFSLQRNGCLQCNIGTNHQASEWIFSATQSIKNLEWLFNFPKGELKYIVFFCHISFGKCLHANDPISVSFLGLNLCKSIAMFISNNEVASKINIVKVWERLLTKPPKNWNSFFSLSIRMVL